MTVISKQSMAEAHEMLGEVLADRMVLLLNEMLELDYEATVGLVFGPHIPCNQGFADHESVQVCDLPREHQVGGRNWGIRVMGLLNGLAGNYPDGFGRVCGMFEVLCPEHGLDKINDGKVVGDQCLMCHKTLTLGKLCKFARVPPEGHSAKPAPEQESVH